jgi:hypothetical protein
MTRALEILAIWIAFNIAVFLQLLYAANCRESNTSQGVEATADLSPAASREVVASVIQVRS